MKPPTLGPIPRWSFAGRRPEQYNWNLTHGGPILTFSNRQR